MCTAKVKVNIDLVENRLKVLGMSMASLSHSMGHSTSWWHSVKHAGGEMSENKAKLLALMISMDVNNIIFKEDDVPTKDAETDKILMETVARIEAQVNNIAEETAKNLARLEIQMRTILKELGVK